jgi:iron complex outermembrane recepter protein
VASRARTQRAGTAGRTRRGLIGRTFGVAVVAALLCAARLSAEDAEPERLGEVIVVAPRATTPTANADPTAAATAVDTRAAPTTAVSLADVLDTVPGVQVRRFGGVGEYSTVSIRGYAPGAVQFYLDGVPLSRAQNETVNLADLPLDAVERVEVYRGTTPIGFLRSGPGGVVNIVTRRPGDQPVTAASLGYGSYDYRKLDVTRAATHGAWDYLAFAHYLGSEGDFPFINDRGTTAGPGGRNDDIEQRRSNNAFNLVDGTIRIGWRPSPGARFAFTNETFYRTGGLAGVGNRQTRRAHQATFRELAHLDGTLTPSWSWPTTFDLSGYTVLEQSALRIPIDELGFGRADRDTQTLTSGGQVLARTQIGTHQLASMLVGGAYEQFSATDRLCLRARPTRTRSTVTVAVQDEVVLFDDRVALVPSLRFEHLASAFPADPCQPRVLRRSGRVVQDLWSPHLGVRVQVQPWLTLLANGGQYERAPNFGELFGEEGRVRGNPALRNERARNLDAGARITLPALVSWLDEATFEYTFFDARIENLIQLVSLSASVASPLNIGRGYIHGHEFGVRSRWFDRWSLQATYTHQSPFDRSAADQDRTNRGRRLPGRPADDLYARLELVWSPTRPLPVGAWAARLWPGRLWYDVNWIGENFLDRANRTPIAARELHGLTLDLALPLPRLRLALEAKNLSDNRTRDVLGYPVPGRTFYATLSWGFGAAAESSGDGAHGD